jgi:tetratricopeptide (TPR) repeat protein
MFRLICAFAGCCALMQGSAVASDHQSYLDLKQQGRVEYSSGVYKAAEKSFTAALDALDKTNYRERAETLAELGSVYANEDELLKGERAYRESLTIYGELRDGKRSATVLRLLGALYSLAGRDDDALRVLGEAFKFATSNRDTALEADVLNITGTVYYRKRNYKKAADCYGQALRNVDSPGVQPDLRTQLLNNLGNVYQAQHKYPEAERFLKEALKQIESDVGPSHPNLTFTLSSLGYLYGATGRYADAEDQYRRALAILEPQQSEFETRIARLLHAMGAMYAKVGRRVEADAALERATTFARRHVSEHLDMASIIEDYATSLKNRGRAQEAAELLTELRRAQTASGLVVSAPPIVKER